MQQHPECFWSERLVLLGEKQPWARNVRVLRQLGFQPGPPAVVSRGRRPEPLVGAGAEGQELHHRLELAKRLLLVWCLRLTKASRLLFLGILTTGTDNYYVGSFILFFSKDRKNWKLYKGAMSKEQKVNVGPRNLLMCSSPAECLATRPPGVND